MDIKTLGIDLAKNIFQLHGVNDAGQDVCKRVQQAEELEPQAPLLFDKKL